MRSIVGASLFDSGLDTLWYGALAQGHGLQIYHKVKGPKLGRTGVLKARQ